MSGRGRIEGTLTEAHLTWFVSAPKSCLLFFQNQICDWNVFGWGEELLAAQFGNIMVSFRQLRDVLDRRLKTSQRRWEASRWQTDVMRGEENRLNTDSSPSWLSGKQPMAAPVLLSLQRWGTESTSFGGRRWVTHTKQNTLSEGMNKGPFGPSWSCHTCDQGCFEYRGNYTGETFSATPQIDIREYRKRIG